MKSAAILLSLLLLFTLMGCSKKGESEENATIASQKEGNVSRFGSSLSSRGRSFFLKDIDDRELNITIGEKEIESRDIDQSLILLNFFATWCPPCRGELPDFSQLQRKYAKDLFIIGILVNDEQNSTQLRSFMERYGANYFISYSKTNDELSAQVIRDLNLSENFPIPLSVLYNNGKFYRYYEGAIPVEMMENELRQVLGQTSKEK